MGHGEHRRYCPLRSQFGHIFGIGALIRLVAVEGFKLWFGQVPWGAFGAFRASSRCRNSSACCPASCFSRVSWFMRFCTLLSFGASVSASDSVISVALASISTTSASGAGDDSTIGSVHLLHSSLVMQKPCFKDKVARPLRGGQGNGFFLVIRQTAASEDKAD